ncbi:MAG: hypothetical protein FWD74_06065 [Actinomycetia bacterium]|nr:hypothetical protein [Actinomycetes bacterium]
MTAGPGDPFLVPADARRVVVAADRLARWLEGFAARHEGMVAAADPTGAVVTLAGGDGAAAWLEVPFPPLAADAPTVDDLGKSASHLRESRDHDAGPGGGPDAESGAEPDTGRDGVAGDADLLGSLVAHVARRRRVGVLLVRRGGHAAGVFDGDTLVSSKVGSAYVQGATKAGGWSQQRFARRRDNQARAAFAEAADTAARILLPERALEHLVCGGDRAAIAAVLADPRLAPLAPLRTGPLLAVPDPRLRVLQDTPRQFRAVRIALLP